MGMAKQTVLTSLISALFGFGAGWVYFTWHVYTCETPIDRSAYKNTIFDFFDTRPLLSFEAQDADILLRAGSKRPVAPINSAASKEIIHKIAGLGTNIPCPITVSPAMTINQLLHVRDSLREQGIPQLRLLVSAKKPSTEEGSSDVFAELKLGDFQSYYWHQKEWFFEDRKAR